MPELPEVESVRLGLSRHCVNASIEKVLVKHPRALHRTPMGAKQFQDRLKGQKILEICRRGKYLWFVLDSDFLVAHLGMSGQFRVDHSSPKHPHARAVFTLRKLESETPLTFLDQRTFGGFLLEDRDGDIPASISHIAPDPFDPAFTIRQVIEKISRKDVEIKRLLLDQSLISGIGNIYADEALFRAKIHPRSHGLNLSERQIRTLLKAARSVMEEALEVGGTTFDELFVNVNGESGYFERELAVYQRHGQPCPVCGTPVQRESFANRGSHFCPRCQPI